MADDLHRSTWFTYRRAICGDASWDAVDAFQAALDVVLHRRPGIDAVSACSEAARMIMTRPRGIANRARVVDAAFEAQPFETGRVVAVASFIPARVRRAVRH
jgi:hypothetical protein